MSVTTVAAVVSAGIAGGFSPASQDGKASVSVKSQLGRFSSLDGAVPCLESSKGDPVTVRYTIADAPKDASKPPRQPGDAKKTHKQRVRENKMRRAEKAAARAEANRVDRQIHDDPACRVTAPQLARIVANNDLTSTLGANIPINFPAGELQSGDEIAVCVYDHPFPGNSPVPCMPPGVRSIELSGPSGSYQGDPNNPDSVALSCLIDGTPAGSGAINNQGLLNVTGPVSGPQSLTLRVNAGSSPIGGRAQIRIVWGSPARGYHSTTADINLPAAPPPPPPPPSFDPTVDPTVGPTADPTAAPHRESSAPSQARRTSAPTPRTSAPTLRTLSPVQVGSRSPVPSPVRSKSPTRPPSKTSNGQKNDKTSSGWSGLSGGAKTGILIGAVAFVVAAGITVAAKFGAFRRVLGGSSSTTVNNYEDGGDDGGEANNNGGASNNGDGSRFISESAV